MNLDLETFEILYSGMDRIKARDLLQSFTTQDWSQSKQETRDRLHRKIFSVAYPDELKKKAVTADKLQGIATITKEMINGR